ncbi:DUF1177 domain-containing protein [Candidatus Bipolaricaulota bacterium]|nr:DUF1177 domain-containing protein [Candidatus Bipolaricaulota bacterium]
MLREVMEAMELLEGADAGGLAAREWLCSLGLQEDEIQVTQIEGEKGKTEFIKVTISQEGTTGPTLGIIGRLGGVGARPHRLGLVSDADGAIVALACAAKLARMRARGDLLPGTVIISTHICPNAPIIPHDPTPFMGAPVDMAVMNRYEVDPRMQAILSIDTTKGNWILNRRGFAITPTVKEGYILKVSPDLLEIMRFVAGEPPAVLPITTQDITPYGNGIYHINSIMQPACATSAPVVGVATTASTPVPGCATGANQAFDLEMTARFCVEVAKAFTKGECRFYDPEEFRKLVSLYGSMRHLQTLGKEAR